MYWAKYHLQHLKKWREAAEAIAKAVKDLHIKAEVYVIGGAAEDRLTVLSDIDILLCLEEKPKIEDVWILRRKVLEIAMDKYGLPIDYPIELHIQDKKTCNQTLQHRKAIKINTST
ncbi:MAG: hypothetical protein DRJ40_02620 [Thermoprotei archaeon]|nr:MAG: hypothetical protein DRJ40_02620 [Thermoprotei archaeon]